jgi:YD repeat-containing protein
MTRVAIKFISLTAIAAVTSYLIFAPVGIEPVAWQAPENPGLTGVYAQNQTLSQIQRIALNGGEGPEDFAADAQGNVYFSLLAGDIQKIDGQGKITQFVNTGGRPLGIEFDAQGNLIVADAFRGLLSIDPQGKITELVTHVDGLPILYADDVDIAADGRIYFSDASSKFSAKQYGTYGGSLLDINEHGGHGRVLEYNPATGLTSILLSGLNFANGVSVSHDQQFLLVNETGSYRILKTPLHGPERGKIQVLLDNLPGFPDNLNRGHEGVYWLGLVSPRSAPLDAMSSNPGLRKVVQRLPDFMRPKAARFGHLVAFDEEGKVLFSLQDPLGMYGYTTGALEIGDKLYVSSLHETALGLTINPFPAAKISAE